MSVDGIQIESGGSTDLVKISNNIIFDIDNVNTDSGSKSSGIRHKPDAAVTTYIYNNTIYEVTSAANTAAARGIFEDSSDSNTTMVLKNNYVGKTTCVSCSVVADYVSGSGPTVLADNNVSSDTTADDFTGANNKISETDYATYFANVTPGSENFHLLGDSNALWGTYGEDVDADANLPVTVDFDGAARDGTQPDIGADEAPTVSVAITATTPGSLAESNLDIATLTVTLTNGWYDASLSTSDFTLNGAPTGTTINSVVRDSATQATLALDFNGTDFSSNASMSVTVLQAALMSGVGPATTGTVTVTAAGVTASITGTNPSQLRESNLAGATVTVDLTYGSGTYQDVPPLVTGNFTLNGAPTGTTIDSLVRVSATQVTLTLAFDGTDFDPDASMSVTVEAAALVSGGPATTEPVTVLAENLFDFRKKIEIDRFKIPAGSGGATMLNFPLLFSVFDADLIQDTDCATAVDGPCDAEGDDMVFRALDTATCGGTAPCTLDHEIERYTASTGELIAWVRLPSVKTDDGGNSTNTEIYIYYGNTSITSSVENIGYIRVSQRA